GAPAPLAVSRQLIASRLRRAARAIAWRWVSAATGGGVAAMLAGAAGGVLLTIVPGSTEPIAVIPVLAIIGGVCGALGGTGVGAGLSVAEAVARSMRGVALIAGAALGGAVVGSAGPWRAPPGVVGSARGP